MITVRITRTLEIPYEETVNFLIKKTPTDKIKSKEYGSGTETAFAEEYQPSVAKKVKTTTVELLEQNIEDESTFDLAAVIKAVNKL